MTSVLNPACKVAKTMAETKADGKSNDPVTQTASSAKKSNGKRKSASLPSETVEYLKAWMMSPEHIAHPYPTEQEKIEIMKDTKIELKQLTNWFVNNRKRYWKPRVEARLQQQAQAAQAAVQAHAAAVAAITAANSLPQQQQMVAHSSPHSSPEISRATLVSPSVGFKYSSQSSLSSQPISAPVLSFNQSSVSSSGVQEQVFASSPLAFAAQLVEQSRKPGVSIPTTFTGGAVNVNTTFLSSAASVSASEGEISDCGNTSDDASSDGATILGTNLKFIDLKTKKSKPRTSSISLSSLSPEIPRQTMDIKTRNVSFCSLDKINFEAASSSASHGCQARSSTNVKKRSFAANNDEEFPSVVTTSSSSSQERKRYRTVSVDLWRKKCQDASHINDDALPSLEEASRLFGYTSA